MTVKLVAGFISKLAISSSGIAFEVNEGADSLMLSTKHVNYNAVASALYLAAANTFRIDVKTELDGRTAEVVQVYP